MTPRQRDLLLSFSGPEKGFQAPSRVPYEVHEEWRQSVLAALYDLENQGLLDTRSPKVCSNHGKCQKDPIAIVCRLTDDGEDVREELGPGYRRGA